MNTPAANASPTTATFTTQQLLPVQQLTKLQTAINAAIQARWSYVQFRAQPQPTPAAACHRRKQRD